MKTVIKNYLIQRPSLFAWLIVLLLLAMVYYSVFGLIAIWQGSEGVMAFMMIPYLSTFLILLLLADLFFRKYFKDKLSLVWLTEAAIVSVFGGWLGYRNLYTTEFVTKDLSPLIVVAELPGGKAPAKSLIKFKTTYTAGINNVVLTNKPIKENQWRRLRARTEDGRKYSQVYGMMYMDTTYNSVTCQGKTYPIQFLMLESDALPRFIFSEKQFDSMRNVICQTIAEGHK